MPEFISANYKRLFEVRLLHHYFLDEGQADFTALPPDKQNKYLSAYDCRRFFSINPADSTLQILQGLGCRFCTLPAGFTVVAPDHRAIPANAVFDFTVTVRDPEFFNYTALTLWKRDIYEIKKEERLFRFKENVFLFSNLNGVQNSGKLFLSKSYPQWNPANVWPAEAILTDGADLVQLTGDYPGSGVPLRRVLGPATGFPLFVNTEDVPLTAAPPGLSGVPPRGVELRDEWPRDLFALIRVAAKRPGDPDFSLVDRNVPEGPVFELHFKNRSTRWRYFKKNDQSFVAEEPAPLPLTFSGNAGTRQKPSAGLVKAEYDSPQTKRITELVSEIYE